MHQKRTENLSETIVETKVLDVLEKNRDFFDLTQPLDRSQSVCRYTLDLQAETRPDKTFIVDEDRNEISFAQFRRDVVHTANALRALGVKQGDHVLLWLPNSYNIVRLWFGINYLGGVAVIINPAYRGSILEHVIAVSGASLLICHGQLVERLATIELAALKQVAVLGNAGVDESRLEVVPAERLTSDDDTVTPLDRPVEPWDTQLILYTSGTTGRSKAVICCYWHMGTLGRTLPMDETDRCLLDTPLFHVTAVTFAIETLRLGASFAIVDSFKTDLFWEVINTRRITVCCMLGVMSSFVLKMPKRPDDRDNCLRRVLALPISEDTFEFARRFGVDIHTCYGMTEMSVPLISEVNPSKIGSCGKPRGGVEARIVDENDCDVPEGEIGELIVRTKSTWAMNRGYYRNPEATAEAWRNGWFHSGDLFRRDDDGVYYFVDRRKDMIRRRGENISSFEVESEAIQHPAVKEAAAVAVKSEISEDEVLLCLAPASGHAVDPESVVRFLIERLPHFMVPRYIKVLDQLPKTPTQKVDKVALRAEGLGNLFWDMQKHSEIRVKSQKLERIG